MARTFQRPFPSVAKQVQELGERMRLARLRRKPADFYRCEDRAAKIIDEVHTAVHAWRQEAERLGLPSLEIKRMESVFLQA
jgi:hypothetical protein